MDAAVVDAALAALPDPARPDFGVKAGRARRSRIPSPWRQPFPAILPRPNLFIAGDEGFTFGAPVSTVKDGRTLFTTQVGLPGRQQARVPGLHYTLVTESGAVSGLLPYF